MTDRLGEALARSECAECGGQGGFHFGWCGDPMLAAVHRQMQRAQAAAWIDRRGWTDDEWIDDAERLMNELDGAVTSLVNGHVMALLRQVAAARSWHTLTNPTDELIERLAWRIVGERSLVDVVNNDPGPAARRLVRSVLDALTVTADKETPND